MSVWNTAWRRCCRLLSLIYVTHLGICFFIATLFQCEHLTALSSCTICTNLPVIALQLLLQCWANGRTSLHSLIHSLKGPLLKRSSERWGRREHRKWINVSSSQTAPPSPSGHQPVEERDVCTAPMSSFLCDVLIFRPAGVRPVNRVIFDLVDYKNRTDDLWRTQ